MNNRPPDIVVPAATGQTAAADSLSFPIVRLSDGVNREQGAARIAQVLEVVAPTPDGRPRAVALQSLREHQVAGGRPTARVLFAGALLVVLLAGINLVHLLLVRGASRAAEVATRMALGASRWRIAQLFLAESLAVGAVGIAGGLVLGAWLSALIEARVPSVPTGGRNLALVPILFDWRVITLAAALGVTLAVLGGCWPAWRALRRPLTAASRSSAGVVPSVPRRVFRVILTSELAVATTIIGRVDSRHDCSGRAGTIAGCGSRRDSALGTAGLSDHFRDALRSRLR